MRVGRFTAAVATVVISGFGWILGAPTPAGATTVTTEAALRAAFGDSSETAIVLASSVDLVDCSPTGGDLDRNSGTALTIEGAGFTVRQTCAGERVAEQVGVGALTFSDITVTGGDLHEDTTATSVNGGGVTSAGDVTVLSSVFSGNAVRNESGLARGGAIAANALIDVQDSVFTENRATGGGSAAGGAIDGHGVTITRSQIRGNETYAEGTDASVSGGGVVSAGSLMVVESSVSGNQASAVGSSSAFAEGGGVIAFSPSSALAPIVIDASHVDGNVLEARGGSNAATDGGGLWAVGNVYLKNSSVDGNTSELHSAEANLASGGGISIPLPFHGLPTGSLVAQASSVSRNAIDSRDAPQSMADGGGVRAAYVSLDGGQVDDNQVTAVDTARGGGLSGWVPRITRTTITGNEVVATSSQGHAVGGGITAIGDLGSATSTIESSTISRNRASSAGETSGGGLAQGFLMLTVVNTTVTENVADGSGTGGGIGRAANAPLLQLVYATVTENAASSGANIGVRASPGDQTPLPHPLDVFGTVVAATAGGTNCAGLQTIESRGHNASDDGSCGFGATTDITITDPELGALADNGGPTSTMLPTTTSPLVDVIPVDACESDGAAGVTTDQRGVTRPQGSGCDIGAVEIAGIAVPLSIVVVPRFTG